MPKKAPKPSAEMLLIEKIKRHPDLAFVAWCEDNHNPEWLTVEDAKRDYLVWLRHLRTTQPPWRTDDTTNR
jgi:hypothetical protein